MKTMRKLVQLVTAATCLHAPVALMGLGCQPPPAVAPEDGTNPPADATAQTEPAQEGAQAEDAQPEAEAVDQSNLPPAEQLLARSVEAVGGQAKIDSIKSFYQETKLEIPAQSMSMITRVWWKGGQLYAETEMPAVGTTRMWKTDKGLWADDPINGMREVTGKEARQTGWSNAVYLPAEWNKHFESAETTGRRKVNDKLLVDVKLTSADGDELTLSFDESTALLAEQSFLQESPVGSMPITIRVEEYKDYDGFKSASKMVMDMKVAQATQEVLKFEPNAKVDAKKLVPPKAKKKSAADPKKAPKGKAAPKDAAAASQ